MLRIRRRPAKTLEVVDHWAPDADYLSLALNHDGRSCPRLPLRALPDGACTKSS